MDWYFLWEVVKIVAGVAIAGCFFAFFVWARIYQIQVYRARCQNPDLVALGCPTIRRILAEVIAGTTKAADDTAAEAAFRAKWADAVAELRAKGHVVNNYKHAAIIYGC